MPNTVFKITTLLVSMYAVSSLCICLCSAEQSTELCVEQCACDEQHAVLVKHSHNAFQTVLVDLTMHL
jgi:hypothetical protein